MCQIGARALVKQKQPGWSWAPLLQPPAKKMWLACWEGCVPPPLLHHRLYPLHVPMQLLIIVQQSQPLLQKMAVVLLPFSKVQQAMSGSKGQLSW